MMLSIDQASVSSGDYRRAAMSHGRPVLDSGDYRYGFAVTERKQVAAGEYVLVVSTFESGQIGVFNVHLSATVKLSVRNLP